jgi:hypothetical protein
MANHSAQLDAEIVPALERRHFKRVAMTAVSVIWTDLKSLRGV